MNETLLLHRKDFDIRLVRHLRHHGKRIGNTEAVRFSTMENSDNVSLHGPSITHNLSRNEEVIALAQG